jgi:hypothetical protein
MCRREDITEDAKEADEEKWIREERGEDLYNMWRDGG